MHSCKHPCSGTNEKLQVVVTCLWSLGILLQILRKANPTIWIFALAWQMAFGRLKKDLQEVSLICSECILVASSVMAEGTCGNRQAV